jgi:uncharacterized protein DUF349
MSLFSRLFGKAPPVVAPPEKLDESLDAPLPDPSGPMSQTRAPERALAAAKEEEELKAAIEAHDAQAIARFVTQGSSTKVRQQAAHAIEDPAQLRQLIKEVRGGNDKTVYKILTQKRDVDLALTRQAQQRRAEVEAAAAAIERHSHRHYDAVYTPTLDQLEIRWQAIAADAEPELQQKVQAAIDRAREVIAQHLRQIAIEASRELAAANAAAHAQAVREQEQKAAAAEAAERARIAEEERKALAEKREAEAQALRQIGGLIRKAQGALTEGSTGRAAGLRRAIEEKLAGSPALPAPLSNQLQQLDKKLAELKDWKNFTVVPKRLELMEEMESLVGSSVDPPVLAERIKSLQEDWRTLSKGAGENLEADWQRFQEAAQKAYQPCREYFEAQALQRQENLHKRTALFERLAAFEAGHNWEQPDWRTVVVALRESRQEWRRYAAVDRAPGKALQQKFDALTASLQARLDAEYARNIKARQTLVERAQRLLGSEDSRQAIEDVKALQQQWRTVGLVPRPEDQRLWEQFRQHCDAVFQKRQHESNEYTVALEANKAKALALCEELESVARLSGKELLEGAAKAPDLRVTFEALGEFPRSDARALHARLERALESCERAAAQQKADDAQRSWSDLFEAANRVRAYRLATSRAADAAESDALRQEAESYMAAVERWPKGGLETLKRELARENSGDIAANEKALRLLCIRAEILTDTPTPPEDQSLRREYQVQRLIRNMGQGTHADEAQLDAMAMEWVSVGPTEEATYLPLLKRFQRCWERYAAGLRPRP